MMHLFINSLAASAGGGLTYIRNVIPLLAGKPDLKVTIALSRRSREEFREVSNVDFLEVETAPIGRVWYEQRTLARLIRNCGAQVLLSAGNFALRKSPVPQILLSRNSVYTSSDFYRDLRARHDYKAWVDTRLRGWLAKKSIQWADVTVAPSEAFAAELRRWTGRPVMTIHHGFNCEAFTSDRLPLDPEVESKLQNAGGCLKLLFVSHYNYYRNFETLLRALPLLRQRLAGRQVKLLLTCKLLAGENPGSYDPAGAARLIKELSVSEMVVELGSIPYHQLHHVYRRADVYVTPAYTETFAHPLVEAMACALPVVASDLPVHREICAEAAVYFPRFSPALLCKSVVRVADSRDASRRMSEVGIERSRQFSWHEHVDAIIDLSAELIGSKPLRSAREMAAKEANR